MDYYRIGRVIKELRMQRSMTQKELSELICTQGQLSKIEKGEVIPNSSTLYELAGRLGVEISYIYEQASSERSDYVTETFKIIRQAIRDRDYEKVSEIIRAEKNNQLFQAPASRQFLTWHEGIIAYYTERNVERSLQLLQEATEITHQSSVYTERHCEILNSIGIIHFEEEQYDKAIIHFQKALDLLSQTPHEIDITIKIRILYNLSKACHLLKRYEKAIKYARQGIRACKRSEMMYLLGELYFQCASSMLAAGKEPSKVSQLLEQSLALFSLQEKHHFSEVVQQQLKMVNESTYMQVVPAQRKKES
ncbi:helix-turn-helix domain-containing protein [Tumebacillus lipolyticus]|uniref:Tetratricopeptide repeat protein n=1 Tax=Tumebacillus lipolyticus TaxID=1280370 RepID=A0ABW4ZWI7_9BACL